MKPTWDALMEKYEGSASVIIADVDCTVEQDLCSDYEVRGYPTIKYFNSETDPKGDSYNGGRDKDSLEKFVEDNLAAKCLVEDTAGCTEKELAFMKKMQDKGAEEIAKQLSRLEGMKGDAMKPDLKAWLIQRLNILKQL